jgi:probable rRNA maturation factor
MPSLWAPLLGDLKMINIKCKQKFRSEINKSILVTAAKKTLEFAQDPIDYDLSIVIEDDQTIEKLNGKYRKINKPTDVLSFESGEIDPETNRVYLGDIIISFDRAKVQAEACDHPLYDELQLLTVHGVLHLLGYDHADDEQKQKMWIIQESILKQLGCKIRKIFDDE